LLLELPEFGRARFLADSKAANPAAKGKNPNDSQRHEDDDENPSWRAQHENQVTATVVFSRKLIKLGFRKFSRECVLVGLSENAVGFSWGNVAVIYEMISQLLMNIFGGDE
jgi:hypothetical protein